MRLPGEYFYKSLFAIGRHTGGDGGDAYGCNRPTACRGYRNADRAYSRYSHDIHRHVPDAASLRHRIA
ncbi:hypothetical protein AYJ54_05120 [Bradyrhizobium centrolobii]|uniref:Uncharacterized protein n=1 Tax=Bradyrhizobium centrolobii TaxID=1505087 RepID=A0A176ZA61_9BRAD|nr:hypothetical protein AYJ54_05120 [Bradyrhizobium centrolobii]